MGTNCVLLLADIFLYSYEAGFIQSLLSTKRKQLASQFNFKYRYIDDVLSINNPEFENYLGQMYPVELEIKDTVESNTSASYLDLLLSIGRDGQLQTSIYDKRDDFNFHITNFPFLSRNIPTSPDYGVFISPIRYARACSSYMDVLYWGRRDFQILSFSNRDTSRIAWNRHWGSVVVDTGILSNNMKFPSPKCYMTFCDLTICNGKPLLIRLFTELDLLPNYERFPWNICDGCGMPTGDAYSSGYLVPSIWGLHMFYLMRSILFPNLSLFFWTVLFEYPSVLSRFCSLDMERKKFCAVYGFDMCLNDFDTIYLTCIQC